MVTNAPALDYGALDTLVSGIPHLRHISIAAAPYETGHAWECQLRGFTRNPDSNVSTATTWRGTGATIEEAITNAVNASRVHVHRYDAKTSYEDSRWVDAEVIRAG